MLNTHSQNNKTFSSRRRLLRLGAYAPPAVLGAMIISQQDAWASGEKKSDKDSNSSGGGGNASCAPCFCAPCGRDGSKNSKACDDKKQGCSSSSDNSSKKSES
ncbi:MAG: hypothetical protein R8J85_07690 [Mariprofundales bacterium]